MGFRVYFSRFFFVHDAIVPKFFYGEVSTKFNSMLLIGALAFFILMVSITLLDTLYRDDVVPSF